MRACVRAERLKELLKSPVKLYTPIVVSAKTMHGMDALREQLLDIAFDTNSFPSFGSLQPRSYMVLREQLRIGQQKNQLKRKDIPQYLQQEVDSNSSTRAFEVRYLGYEMEPELQVYCFVMEIRINGVVVQPLTLLYDQCVEWHKRLQVANRGKSIPGLPQLPDHVDKFHVHQRALVLCEYLQGLMDQSGPCEHSAFGNVVGFDGPSLRKVYASTLRNIQQDPALIDRALHFLRTTGDVLYYDHIPGLSERIFIRPQWLVNVMKQLVRHDLEEQLQAICAPYDQQAKTHLRQLGRDFVQKGELHKRLLLELWRIADVAGSDAELQQDLISLLESLSLVVMDPSPNRAGQWLVPLRLPLDRPELPAAWQETMQESAMGSVVC
eukprot:COSAG06_NODE_14278_length_1172_cov_0.781920_1_plen_380_part_01